ncbi:hypothetical protein NUSPORA_01409 [Nucleospora cyclopteri]
MGENKIPCKKISSLIIKRSRTRSESEKQEINKEIRKECALLQKKRYLKFIKDGIRKLKEKNSREAWRFIKTKSGLGSSNIVNCSFKCNFTQVKKHDEEGKAEIAATHLENLFKLPAAYEKKFSIDVGNFYNRRDITDSPIDWTEIKNVLCSIKNNKAASRDGIPVEVYKLAERDTEGNSGLAKAMKKLFNMILDEGKIPEAWNSSLGVLIFKKGDKKKLNDYRGITLINTLSKVFLKIFTNRVMASHYIKKIVGKHQVGFMPGIEGLSAVMSLIESVQRRNREGSKTWVTFLDLKKAYDLVPHDLLIKKLKMKGLGKKFIKVIESLYKANKSCVRVGSTLSRKIK